METSSYSFSQQKNFKAMVSSEPPWPGDCVCFRRASPLGPRHLVFFFLQSSPGFSFLWNFSPSTPPPRASPCCRCSRWHFPSQLCWEFSQVLSLDPFSTAPQIRTRLSMARNLLAKTPCFYPSSSSRQGCKGGSPPLRHSSLITFHGRGGRPNSLSPRKRDNLPFLFLGLRTRSASTGRTNPASLPKGTTSSPQNRGFLFSRAEDPPSALIEEGALFSSKSDDRLFSVAVRRGASVFFFLVRSRPSEDEVAFFFKVRCFPYHALLRVRPDRRFFFFFFLSFPSRFFSPLIRRGSRLLLASRDMIPRGRSFQRGAPPRKLIPTFYSSPFRLR